MRVRPVSAGAHPTPETIQVRCVGAWYLEVSGLLPFTAYRLLTADYMLLLIFRTEHPLFGLFAIDGPRSPGLAIVERMWQQHPSLIDLVNLVCMLEWAGRYRSATYGLQMGADDPHRPVGTRCVRLGPVTVARSVWSWLLDKYRQLQTHNRGWARFLDGHPHGWTGAVGPDFGEMREDELRDRLLWDQKGPEAFCIQCGLWGSSSMPADCTDPRDPRHGEWWRPRWACLDCECAEPHRRITLALAMVWRPWVFPPLDSHFDGEHLGCDKLRASFAGRSVFVWTHQVATDGTAQQTSGNGLASEREAFRTVVTDAACLWMPTHDARLCVPRVRPEQVRPSKRKRGGGTHTLPSAQEKEMPATDADVMLVQQLLLEQSYRRAGRHGYT